MPIIEAAIANPHISIPIATSLASSLYRFFSPDEAKRLQDETIEGMTQFRDRLARHAFGEFSVSDIESIQRSSQPQVNQVAAGVSTRGLGQSGAGGQIIAEAQQRPFTEAREEALRVLPQADANLFQASRQLLNDNSFMDDIVAISKLLAKRKFKGDNDIVPGIVGDIYGSVMGQGYQIPSTGIDGDFTFQDYLGSK